MGRPIPIEFETQELPMTQIQGPAFQECLGHWQAARNGRSMPARRDVHPESIRAAIGFVGMVDILRSAGGLDFRYRMFGSLMAAAIGNDFTGRMVGQIEPASYAAMLRRSYTEAAFARAPRYHRVCFTHGEKQRIYFRLLLPLADDGETPDRLWAVTQDYEEFWVDLNLLLRRAAGA